MCASVCVHVCVGVGVWGCMCVCVHVYVRVCVCMCVRRMGTLLSGRWVSVRVHDTDKTRGVHRTHTPR